MTLPAASPAAFTAVSTSVKQLYALLRPIGFVNRASVILSKDGLKFSVEESRTIQAHAFLDKGLFTSYTFRVSQDDGSGSASTHSFTISLAALLECLQIFGGPKERASDFLGQHMDTASILKIGTTCRMVYQGEGSAFEIVLNDGGVITTCELTTYEPEEMADISFASDALLQKTIMKAEWLYDAISEMDSSEADTLTILTSPHKPYFRLSSSGVMGSVELDYPNDRSVLETFVCSTLSTNVFSTVKRALKAMGVASKVSIRCDDTGVLSMQFMVTLADQRNSFIEFRFLPLDEQVARRDDED